MVQNTGIASCSEEVNKSGKYTACQCVNLCSADPNCNSGRLSSAGACKFCKSNTVENPNFNGYVVFYKKKNGVESN